MVPIMTQGVTLDLIDHLLEVLGLRRAFESILQNELESSDRGHCRIIAGCVWIAVFEAHLIDQALKPNLIDGMGPMPDVSSNDLSIDTLHEIALHKRVKVQELPHLVDVVVKCMPQEDNWAYTAITFVTQRPLEHFLQAVLDFASDQIDSCLGLLFTLLVFFLRIDRTIIPAELFRFSK